MDTNAKFAEDVLNILAKKHDGKEAVSFLMSEMRDKGWRRLGRLHDFERALTEAGFTLTRVYVKGSVCVRAVYVSL